MNFKKTYKTYIKNWDFIKKKPILFWILIILLFVCIILYPVYIYYSSYIEEQGILDARHDNNLENNEIYITKPSFFQNKDNQFILHFAIKKKVLENIIINNLEINIAKKPNTSEMGGGDGLGGGGLDIPIPDNGSYRIVFDNNFILQEENSTNTEYKIESLANIEGFDHKSSMIFNGNTLNISMEGPFELSKEYSKLYITIPKDLQIVDSNLFDAPDDIRIKAQNYKSFGEINSLVDIIDYRHITFTLITDIDRPQLKEIHAYFKNEKYND